MTLNLQEVAAAMRTAKRPSPRKVDGWSVDTRTQNPGDVYFALRGPNFDGHAFIEAAREKGAAAVVVERVSEAQGAGETLVVDDTLCALQRLGQWARTKWGGSVVGVTGSA